MGTKLEIPHDDGSLTTIIKISDNAWYVTVRTGKTTEHKTLSARKLFVLLVEEYRYTAEYAIKALGIK